MWVQYVWVNQQLRDTHVLCQHNANRPAQPKKKRGSFFHQKGAGLVPGSSIQLAKAAFVDTLNPELSAPTGVL